jgi:hypothetical protein
MVGNASTSAPHLPPPLSGKAKRRTFPADTTAEYGFPEDVEEEEWRLAADEADDSAVRRAAALGAGAAQVEKAAAQGGDVAAAVAAARAQAEALAASVPLVHAGPAPISPLVGPLCARRIEGESVHSLMLVVAGAASMHTRQEHAAAEAAVEAVRAGHGVAAAAADAAEGIRGMGRSGTASAATAALNSTGSSSSRTIGGAAASSKSTGRASITSSTGSSGVGGVGGVGGGSRKRRGAATSTVLTKGDFFGGSTLLSKRYKLAARAEVTASARTAMAVVMLLPRATILRWCRLLPNYASKLAQWYEEGAGVDGGAMRRAMFDDMATNAAAASKSARASMNLRPASSAASSHNDEDSAALDEWFFGAMDA